MDTTLPSEAVTNPFEHLGRPRTSAQYLLCSILFSSSVYLRSNSTKLKKAMKWTQTLTDYYSERFSMHEAFDVKEQLFYSHHLMPQMFSRERWNAGLQYLSVFFPSPECLNSLCLVYAPKNNLVHVSDQYLVHASYIQTTINHIGTGRKDKANNPANFMKVSSSFA